MKTINVSDEDYETLMALSKELQLQENHHQAFPYFWEPASQKLKTNYNDEGEVTKIYDPNGDDSCTPEEYTESQDELFELFLNSHGYDEYSDDIEFEWLDYVKENRPDIHIYSEDWEQETEHNPSLFLSDVKGFIESNKHHLGKDPRTYARSVWRMPKMEALVEAIYRLNPQPKEYVNDEAKRFVFKK